MTSSSVENLDKRVVVALPDLDQYAWPGTTAKSAAAGSAPGSSQGLRLRGSSQSRVHEVFSARLARPHPQNNRDKKTSTGGRH